MKFNHLEMKSCLPATPCAANGPQLTMWLMLVMVLSAMFALIHPTHAIAGEMPAGSLNVLSSGSFHTCGLTIQNRAIFVPADCFSG